MTYDELEAQVVALRQDVAELKAMLSSEALTEQVASQLIPAIERAASFTVPSEYKGMRLDAKVSDTNSVVRAESE